MYDDSKKKVWVGAGVAVVAAATGLYLWLREPAPEPVQPAAVLPAAETPPPEHHPVIAEQPAPTLPALQESDPAMLSALGNVFSARALDEFLVPSDLIRHIVVTVDNLPRKKVAERLKPIKPVSGQFMVTGGEDARVLSDDNFARYQSLIHVVSAADTQQVANLYFRFYPLFQEAYVDLGYPDGYFNDRLISVIDHLLATPDVAGPIKLTQPGVLYEYADPKIENLSAGQKAFIRMGKANSAVVKTKLRELRELIAKGKL